MIPPTRKRFEVYAQEYGIGYFVHDVVEHRKVWSDRHIGQCIEVCDLLNEAFEAGRESVLGEIPGAV